MSSNQASHRAAPMPLEAPPVNAGLDRVVLGRTGDRRPIELGLPGATEGARDMWSNPDLHWDGFTAVEYSLDTNRVLELPLVSRPATGTEAADVPTTVGGVLRNAVDRQFKTVTPGVLEGHTVTLPTDAGDIVLPCSPFCSRLVSMLLEFRSEGVNPFDTSWFWFDSDSVTDDPHERYAFFVVHGGKIIREQLSFSDHSESGFDPRILVTEEDSDPIWFSEKGWNDARLRYWYRKFYRETATGQMMVLRSDEPDLFHYPEGRLLRLLYRSRKLETDDDSETVCAMLASLLLGK